MERYRRPIIAAVNGFALGGGCELAMHCDIIIAGEGAKLGQPEVKLGIMPGAGGTQRFVRAAGKFAAMRWLLTGDLLSASEAQRLGLVSEVVPDGEVLKHALELAARIAALPPLAVAAIKDARAARRGPAARGRRCASRARAFSSCSPPRTGPRACAPSSRSASPSSRGVDVRSSERLDTIGVVGAGAMGAGIAQSALTAGLKVILHDASAAALAKARSEIHSRIVRLAEKGQMTGRRGQ